MSEWKSEYDALREVPGHAICGVRRFLFTYGLVVGMDDTGYAGRYCYEFRAEAVDALREWDGIGDPPGQWIVYKGRGGERMGPGAKT